MTFLLKAVLAGALLSIPSLAAAAEPLVVSVWGGNWKDTVERVMTADFWSEAMAAAESAVEVPFAVRVGEGGASVRLPSSSSRWRTTRSRMRRTPRRAARPASSPKPRARAGPRTAKSRPP